MASGPDFSTGPVDEVSITDVAPTLLHLIGGQVPEKMDGEIVKAMFRKGSRPFLESVRYTDVDFEESMRMKDSIRRMAGRD